MSQEIKPRANPLASKPVREFPQFNPENEDSFIGEGPTPEMLRDLCGTATTEAATGLFMSSVQAMGADEKVYRQFMTTLWAEEKPTSAVEAMLIQQMGALHIATAKLSARFNSGAEPMVQIALLKAMNNSARTFADQALALKKYRSKVSQTVRIERVNVNEGGQAIVGNIGTKGGGG